MNFTEHIEGLYSFETNLDLAQLKKSCFEMQKIISNIFQPDEFGFGHKQKNVSKTTRSYNQYNFLMYPLPGIHDLYWTVHHAFHICLTHSLGIVSDKFMVQSWLNIYNKGEYIDWHHHNHVNAKGWHGFLCVDTEPNSYTSYRWNLPERKDIQIDIPNKDGLLVIGRSNGDEHRSSEWLIEGRPRITIAVDINPTASILPAENAYELYYSNENTNPYYINHWIPI